MLATIFLLCRSFADDRNLNTSSGSSIPCNKARSIQSS